MRLRRRYTTAILVGAIVYSCAQFLFTLDWFSASKGIINVSDITRETSLVTSIPTIAQHYRGAGFANVSKSFKVINFMETRIVKGNFKPSFSIERDHFVSVTTFDRYNEFEYNKFRLPEPIFPRPIDKELFYRLGAGIELMKEVPYERLRGVVEIIHNGSYKEPFLCGWPSNYTSMHMNSPSSSHYHKLCPLMTPEGGTYQHFLDGLLPKLIQIRDFLLDPDMMLMIPPLRRSDEKIIQNVLDHIGIKLSQIVWGNGGPYSADYMVAACITPPLHPALWSTARNLIGVHNTLQVPISESYVILLTRALSHNAGRILLNKEEVVKFLTNRYGVKRVVVFKGGYSFTETLDLFGKAHLIIGIHGGAFYNLNFAPQSAKLLEIMPYMNSGYPGGLATTIFWSMAGMIGQDYWRLFVETSGRPNNVILNITLLNETLQKMGT